ncbi:short-chain alcohol dehydrogenase [Friedmanniomyces endolithicus]|uniref:Short-chain alcohol dehydrogenase n=1 Tax=Friedmanniomyces endolithicus TaxID=329885 RepID=A0AAN6H210_9PEZI|nr:short-chain alcohol dehydrogenase [Friedmanniomyces endolithicus]KAK0790352.1 short-chain alcohol dehydrogenase [Friedmanniomyces endolithicus]KAK0817312.1 short-chain alcohol dehydrogenase [Friedmanniomyces endolithicus]KAK0856794.1 short-chain alcohol dehydrogenase [Friedmanniomyces endolithicus]KAK0866400.1 short-chain alcohol dehydrogenase [Friedmanniomyces endolithicus]
MSFNFAMDAFMQCFFIGTPPLTEQNLPDQSGRVLIVTGGYAGCGKALSSILYSKNGTVYLAGRSPSKAEAAVAEIKSQHPTSDGRLEFLHLDLADLPTIKASAQDFLSREQRLDVLTNNAGVMTPPKGSVTAQNYELQMGTNCLGPFLFTQLLTPLLTKTAASQPPGSVRVTWAASLATAFSPKGGVTLDPQTGAPKVFGDRHTDYAQTKACNALLAREYQTRLGNSSQIVSNAWNPGNLVSELQRHQTFVERVITKALIYPTVFGAYTELFAGWSVEAGREENRGRYVGPWGRFVVLRGDIEGNVEGGGRFWEWCEGETRQYM